MKSILYPLLAVVFLFAACSDDSSTPTQSATGASGEPVSLNGTYSRACQEIGSDSNNATLGISNTTLTQTSIDYVDATDCTGSSTITQVITITSFTLGEEVTPTLDGTEVTATAWTGTITGYTVTPADDAAASAASGSDEFGGTTFTAGQTEDFLEHVDDPALDGSVYLDDSGEGVILYFGSETEVDTEEKWTK